MVFGRSPSAKSNGTNLSAKSLGSKEGASPTVAELKKKFDGKSASDDGSHDGSTQEEEEEFDPDRELISNLLAEQAYHLPNYTYWQDLRQFLLNNHPVFGICCRHPYHPIKSKTRIAGLLASVLFGLAMTNFFYVLFILHENLEQPVASVDLRSPKTATLYNVDGTTTSVEAGSLRDQDLEGVVGIEAGEGSTVVVLTTGMILLWTLGGMLHGLFDLMIWQLAVCKCCKPGGFLDRIDPRLAICPTIGKHMVKVLVLISLGMCAVVAILRVAVTVSDTEETLGTDGVVLLNATELQNGTRFLSFVSEAQQSTKTTTDALRRWDEHPYEVKQFDFLVGFFVELVLALLIYYPIGGFIEFSGVLNCRGCCPWLGGRPREIAKAEKEEMERLKGDTWDDEDVESGDLKQTGSTDMAETTEGDEEYQGVKTNKKKKKKSGCCEDDHKDEGKDEETPRPSQRTEYSRKIEKVDNREKKAHNAQRFKEHTAKFEKDHVEHKPASDKSWNKVINEKDGDKHRNKERSGHSQGSGGSNKEGKKKPNRSRQNE